MPVLYQARIDQHPHGSAPASYTPASVTRISTGAAPPFHRDRVSMIEYVPTHPIGYPIENMDDCKSLVNELTCETWDEVMYPPTTRQFELFACRPSGMPLNGRQRLRDNPEGLVVPLLPPRKNIRLSGQSGLFLMNCNIDLPFEESLARMMMNPS
jgi:hypothetical protein